MSRRSYTPINMAALSNENLLPMTVNDLTPAEQHEPDTLAIPTELRASRSSPSLRSGSSRLFDEPFNRHHGRTGKFRRFGPFKNSRRWRISRILKPPTLDFETAIWEIFYLVVSPRRVYRSLYYHTKNTWARDDPSFMILLTFFLVLSAVAWGLAYSPGFISIIKLILYMVVVDFLIVGVVIATIEWFIANKFFKTKNSNAGRIGMNNTGSSRVSGMSVGSSDSELEWGYCFDVHCNSFLIIWICLYFIQFILLPIITLDNWFSSFIGNTLYAIALGYYFVITFYGYNAMPFLEHTELILFPIPLIAVFYFLSLFGFNISKTMVDYYF